MTPNPQAIFSAPAVRLGDPFGFECGAETTSTVDVNGAKATFGEGGEIVPHLYWRSGRVLDTVSGPFPRRRSPRLLVP